jgi:hypothetical protein
MPREAFFECGLRNLCGFKALLVLLLSILVQGPWSRLREQDPHSSYPGFIHMASISFSFALSTSQIILSLKWGNNVT